MPSCSFWCTLSIRWLGHPFLMLGYDVLCYRLQCRRLFTGQRGLLSLREDGNEIDGHCLPCVKRNRPVATALALAASSNPYLPAPTGTSQLIAGLRVLSQKSHEVCRLLICHPSL